MPRHRRADRLRVPGRAAVPASDRAPEPALRPTGSRRRRDRDTALDADRRAARHRRPARPPARLALRRREAARRDRPRAARRARGCSCSTSRWPRSTRPARSEILPYIERLREAGMPILMSATRSTRWPGSRPTWCCCRPGRSWRPGRWREVMARHRSRQRRREIQGGALLTVRVVGATRAGWADRAGHPAGELTVPALACRWLQPAPAYRRPGRGAGAGQRTASGISIRNQLRATVTALGAVADGRSRSASMSPANGCARGSPPPRPSARPRTRAAGAGAGQERGPGS